MASDFRLSYLYSIIKRLMDLTFILVTAPLWLPLTALLAMAIRIDSEGPIFFVQPRVGQGKEIFRMIKFRTMKVDAEAQGEQLAQTDDQRITAIGKWLRRYRLDEIPQFFNILKGEMSLIGPRPEQISFAQHFEGKDPFLCLSTFSATRNHRLGPGQSWICRG